MSTPNGPKAFRKDPVQTETAIQFRGRKSGARSQRDCQREKVRKLTGRRKPQIDQSSLRKPNFNILTIEILLGHFFRKYSQHLVPRKESKITKTHITQWNNQRTDKIILSNGFYPLLSLIDTPLDKRNTGIWSYRPITFDDVMKSFAA